MKSILKSGLVLLLWQAFALHAAPTVTSIAAGDYDTFFIKSDGSLWAMGYNADGELGDGTFNTAVAPEQIVSSGVIAVATRGFYPPQMGTVPTFRSQTLFLKSNSSLWGMGDNDAGQLGDGTFNSTNQPEEIVSHGVVAIATGFFHSLFVRSDGSLWGMGDNEYGQLGDGTFSNTNRPEEIVSHGVVAVAAGGFHSLFLKSDDSLWAMGNNSYGQLGDGTLNNATRPVEIVSNGVVAIAAGSYYSLFIKSDGSLWGMGDDRYGQLGDRTLNNATRPVEIVSNGVVAIAAGDYHSLFLKSDGSLWAMGNNSTGQLGDGTTQNAYQPEEIVSKGVVAIAAGDGNYGSFYQYSFSLFVKSDGSLWGMGDNSLYELGNGVTTDLLYPEKIVNGRHLRTAMNLTKIAAGLGSSFFIQSGGSLWAMGDNSVGQLGDGTINTAVAPEQIVSSGVIAVAARGFSFGIGTPYITSHTLFLKANGSLWGMGNNRYGQLGDGTYYDTNRPEEIVSCGVVAIATGPFHSLFIRTRLKDFDFRTTRGNGSQISPGERRADEPNEFPDTGTYGYFRHRLRFSGGLWGMGDNYNGQLGKGTSFYGTNRPVEIVSNGVVAVAAGAFHSLFLKTDGSLWAMGDDSYGQLGVGTSASQPVEVVSNGVVAIAAGAYFSLYLKSDGSLWGMGDDRYGQIGQIPYYGNPFQRPYRWEIVSNGVVAVAAGDYHTLFLKSDGSLWAMGNNSSGQLGDGTTQNTDQPQEIVSHGVVAIAAGDYGNFFTAQDSFSLFVKSDGSLWGMGDNSLHELGSGSTNDLLYPEEIVNGR